MHKTDERSTYGCSPVKRWPLHVIDRPGHRDPALPLAIVLQTPSSKPSRLIKSVDYFSHRNSPYVRFTTKRDTVVLREVQEVEVDR